VSIIVWIVLGLIAGWLASAVMGRHGSVLSDILLGILGAIVGGFLSSAIFGWDVTGFNISSVIISVVGAIIVIAIYRALTHSSANA
jgi:uncharacterized membrane protein YeaQ/YmgE (transglycosylase-associated protein family)